MNRTLFCCLFLLGLLAPAATLWSQKGHIVEQASPSGKSSIRDDDSPGKSSVTTPSYSEPTPSYSEPTPSYSEPTPSYSEPTPSYSEPTPSYSEPTPSYSRPTESYSEPVEERPRHSRPKSRGDDDPPATLQAAPKPVSETHAAQSGTSPTMTNTLVQPTLPSDEPLPGIRPVQLPPPPPLDRPMSRNLTDPHATLGQPLLDDSLPPQSAPPVGVNLPIASRPDFQTIDLPDDSLAPVSPTPQPPAQSGGALIGAGDPYNNDNSQTTPTEAYYSSSTAFATPVAPEVMCILQASDALIAFYREPSWCDTRFERGYDQALLDYRTCYGQLDRMLVEPWMWPSYLTFLDERDFWAEECAGGDQFLRAIRDFMREKALMVPNLMVDVDATLRADWIYVDTAFAAPMGGRNYYAMMHAFDPEATLDKLQDAVRDYPEVMRWPSYATLRGFFADYFRSGIWALLRAKAEQDFEQAVALRQSDPVVATQLAENAAWISLAMRRVDLKDTALNRLQGQLKAYLRQDVAAWAQSSLRPLMD